MRDRYTESAFGLMWMSSSLSHWQMSFWLWPLASAVCISGHTARICPMILAGRLSARRLRRACGSDPRVVHLGPLPIRGLRANSVPANTNRIQIFLSVPTNHERKTTDTGACMTEDPVVEHKENVRRGPLHVDPFLSASIR